MINSSISIKEFLDVLASKEPTPGGGAASALVGAIGTALMSMVANLTVGKQKYKESEPLMKELLEEAARLQKDLIKLMEEDTEAFNKVTAAFKMPKNNEEEKAKRKEKVQEALKGAVEAPYEIMEKAVKALHLYEKSLGHTNTSTISDTGVGALCLKTALCGAWLNVKINLGNIDDDDFVQKYNEKVQQLLNEGVTLADAVYEAVLESL
ncbi:cyclodeaminase/cyclohydrolase family protein [Tepidanaerobacter syntrophicus]|uniref:Formiminotetrahydrofolate cyclodeaminase n=1 Tax=Tepidanaerobacter syntrophicus TaxID=224999 RepID=A0A0U9HCF4_9FIRM|nr:cyclodeaminase/cyclohydrolase family protein [Tepidanaerobacter syntrophicus]GAQ24398.1 formiminotetrahydrofolate cyclodeaminase [Tepidanaerobacter syntrophicus]GLI18310.1 sugar ABC transporter substrate-binding protein [Tepidanaerobacter syntrophicus]